MPVTSTDLSCPVPLSLKLSAAGDAVIAEFAVADGLGVGPVDTLIFSGAREAPSAASANAVCAEAKDALKVRKIATTTIAERIAGKIIRSRFVSAVKAPLESVRLRFGCHEKCEVRTSQRPGTPPEERA